MYGGATLGPETDPSTGGGGGGSGTVTTVSNSDGTIVITGTPTVHPIVSRAGITGDVAIPAASNVAILATIVAAGTSGSATQVGQVTIDVKGRVTAATNVSIQIAESQVTNLVSDLALKAPLASPALTGTPTAPTGAPGDTSTQIATDSFVATAVSNAIAGTDYKAAANLATTAALPTNTYSNGASGVGATLTGVAFGALTVDGTVVTVGQRILVKNEAAPANNGIYVVTTVGAVATLYVLTRATDFNQSSNIASGDAVFVISGTANTSTTWVMNQSSAIVVGTTAITWVQISGIGTITAGSNISITGSTISVVTSPAFTGVPTAPTGTAGDNTTQIATDAFVTGAIATTAALGLLKANNLSDVANRGTSRFNLRVPVLAAVQCAATTNINIASPGATIDGFSFITSGSDSVLLTGQTTASQNGLWTWNGATSPLIRTNDFPSGGVLTTGRFVLVQNGTVNADTLWLLNVPSTGLTIDTSSLTWVSLNILGTFANETIIRANSLDQMAVPQGNVSWNSFGITNLATLQMNDGTAAHGKITLSLNAPQESYFANSSDTQPAVQLGIVSSNPSLLLGPGGTTAADVSLIRTATGTMTVQAFSGVAAGSGGVGLFTGITPSTLTSGNLPTLMFGSGSTFTMNYSNGNIGNLININPTIVYQLGGSGLGAGGGVVFAPTLKNLSTAAVGPGLVVAIAYNPLFQGDTQTGLNFGTQIAYSATPTYSVINAGTITASVMRLFNSAPTVNTGVTITSLAHYSVPSDVGGSGTVTLQVGLDMNTKLTRATTNIGIRNASSTVFVPSTAQVLAAAFTVTADATHVQCTSAGAVTGTTAAATIVAPVAAANGQRLTIVNANTAVGRTLTFTSGATELLSLGAATRAVDAGGSLTLIYNSTFGRWIEESFNVGGH